MIYRGDRHARLLRLTLANLQGTMELELSCSCTLCVIVVRLVPNTFMTYAFRFLAGASIQGRLGDSYVIPMGFL